MCMYACIYVCVHVYVKVYAFIYTVYFPKISIEIDTICNNQSLEFLHLYKFLIQKILFHFQKKNENIKNDRLNI